MFLVKVLISFFPLVLVGVYGVPLQRELLDTSSEGTSSDAAPTYVVNFDSVEATTDQYLLYELPIVKRSIIATLEKQKTAVVDSDSSSVEQNDMEVAETHLFRPVFRYKSQYAERRRIRQIPPQFSLVVQQ
ncbi:AAEL003050-PA [Aedes aegypti]|uniref:AAEL003050-PA n=1 Tax=Aedes aegypti TaxID=7159 RepID=Q0IG63_AEDAE|nr:AAEL003050-PA [Aedes aegypti]